MVNLKELGILYCVIFLKIKRSLANFSKASSELIFVLKKYNIKTNEPTANFFLMNFDEAKVNSKDAFNKLGKKGLVLREMKQYKIPNSLRFTIGKDKENELFIKSIREICQ